MRGAGGSEGGFTDCRRISEQRESRHISRTFVELVSPNILEKSDNCIPVLKFDMVGIDESYNSVQHHLDGEN